MDLAYESLILQNVDQNQLIYMYDAGGSELDVQ